MPETSGRQWPLSARFARVRAILAQTSVISGLYACAHPVAAILLVSVLSVFMTAGAAMLRNDDALGSLLRADTRDYTDYDAMKRAFPASEYDVLIALKWRGPFDPAKAEAVRAVHLEESLQDAVDSVTSFFSLRQAPKGEETPPPALPDDLPEKSAFDALMAKVAEDPLVQGRLLLLRPDGGIAIVVVNLDAKSIANLGLVSVVRAIEKTARAFAEPAGLDIGLTGIPVMKAEIIVASSRDRIVFPTLGLLVGVIVCFYFFRSWRYVVICVMPSSLAVLWALGLFGFLGLELDPVKNAILPLVMVVALTDTLHVSIRAKVAYAAGASPVEAARLSVEESGTACALTSLTTAIAFLSMNLTDSALISSFGTSAAIATLLEFILVITAVPALFVLFAPEQDSARGHWEDTTELKALGRFTASLASTVVAYHRPIAAGGIALMALFTVLYLKLPAYYRLSDLVPQRQQAALTADEIETAFGGFYPVSVIVAWPHGVGLDNDKILQAIGRVHHVLEETKGVTKVLSLETVRQWLERTAPTDALRFAKFIERAPPEIAARFLGHKREAALVTGYIGDLHAREVMSLKAEIEKRLDSIRALDPQLTLTVTDISVMAASRSLSIIEQLNSSLLSTVIIDLPTIGLAFGAFVIVAYGAIANIFAVVAMGALIYLLTPGVQYASIIALTVAFGLTADGTIHFLNKVRLETSNGASRSVAVAIAIRHVGSVLLLSTIILLLGLSVTLASAVPPTQMFGQTCALTLLLSLPGLLVLMPAVMLVLSHNSATATPTAPRKDD